jgi:glutamate formiminotransferase/formiminotetrahydrofolate cyclodeaminase
MAAAYYVEKEGLFLLDERQRLRLAVERLGLSSVSRFVPEKRIIEYMIRDEAAEPLAGLSVRAFVERLGARVPAPGGGSASALCAAMGAALGAMVGWMTYGKRRFEDKDAVMRRLIPPLHEAMKDLIPLIDEDTRAFDAYMAALALPRDSPERQAARDRGVQEALRGAVAVPLRVMRSGDRCWDAMLELARHGNIASRSDLEVGARSLEAGIWGAWRNVVTNLGSLQDAEFEAQVAAEAQLLTQRARDAVREVLATLESRKE